MATNCPHQAQIDDSAPTPHPGAYGRATSTRRAARGSQRRRPWDTHICQPTSGFFSPPGCSYPDAEKRHSASICCQYCWPLRQPCSGWSKTTATGWPLHLNQPRSTDSLQHLKRLITPAEWTQFILDLESRPTAPGRPQRFGELVRLPVVIPAEILEQGGRWARCCQECSM